MLYFECLEASSKHATDDAFVGDLHISGYHIRPMDVDDPFVGDLYISGDHISSMDVDDPFVGDLYMSRDHILLRR